MIDKEKLLTNLYQTLEKEEELYEKSPDGYYKGFSKGVQAETNALIRLIRAGCFDS